MIKFNLLRGKKEDVIYEEEITNLFFDGLRNGEYGFIIKMNDNNNGLLHWETNGDLSVVPYIIKNFSLNYHRKEINIGNHYIPGFTTGEFYFNYNHEDLDEIFSKIQSSLISHKTQIILITPQGKSKINAIIKDVVTRDSLNSIENISNICFIIENYEKII